MLGLLWRETSSWLDAQETDVDDLAIRLTGLETCKAVGCERCGRKSLPSLAAALGSGPHWDVS